MYLFDTNTTLGSQSSPYRDILEGIDININLNLSKEFLERLKCQRVALVHKKSNLPFVFPVSHYAKSSDLALLL